METMIRLIYVRRIPEAAMQSVIGAVSDLDTNISIEPRELPGPAATLNWYAATAVGIYLTKSYFDGFLKEMGKDHYTLFKQRMGSMWGLFFGASAPIQMKIVTASGPLEKQEGYSLSLALLAEADDERIFKLLIREDISQAGLELATDAFVHFVDRFHAGELDESHLAQLTAIGTLSATVAVTYNAESGDIEILDPRPAVVFD